jgi:CRISPR/Cas system CSM-associated protein Csm3 (group 7 of RAMP superfamily)
MNPYDFVRIDWASGVERRPAAPLDRLRGINGRLLGTITALTPIFIPGQRGLSPKPFLRDGRGRAVLPGSSLKGLIRSLVETVGPGCWWLFDGKYKNPDGGLDHYEDKLPNEFKRCVRLDRLCVACRLFGMMSNREHLLGKVGFDDAVCVEERKHSPLYTPILDAPKPRHSVWYLSGAWVAGRKFYFHQSSVRAEREFRRAGSGFPLNQYITPLDAGSQFEFTASFNNLDDAAEWSTLLYALVLEEGVRHKMGYAKPAGLGSVHVELKEITIVDPAARYRGARTSSVTYTGEDLRAYLNDKTAVFVNNRASVTLEDLRRIWSWPPAAGVDYKYPGRFWFNENRRAGISETE